MLDSGVGAAATVTAEKKKNKEKGKKKNANKQRRGTDEANVGEEVAFRGDEEHYNFDMYNACNMEGNDECLILYDWLVDSATTSHITHQHEAFTSYTPWGTHCSITGVGGKKALIAGRGTVELSSTCNGQQYTLLLLNVLHVPRTRNNLVSLGRWDAAGGNSFEGKGSITLVTKDERHVAHGKKIDNHLYRMKLTVQKPHSIPSKNPTVNP
jgi:hypothetical protein